MAENSFALYVKINRDNYKSLIDEILAETAATDKVSVSKEILEARAAFIETAIAKSAPLAGLPSQMRGKNADELAIAAQKIPDKEGRGNRGKISFNERDREAFARAAAERKPGDRWDTLFPEGEDDLVIDFAEETELGVNKIQSFIDAHNERAIRLVETERAGRSVAAELAAMPKVTRQIARHLIRQNPQDLSRLQIRKQGEADDWGAGPRFGRYLQDLYEWELLDIFDRETSRIKLSERAGNGAALDLASRRASLRSIAGREALPADGLLNAGKLQIVVTRDPQKIAEESTGQRWLSCMAKDGCNFLFVAKDIEAGTLAVYVVFKGDSAARYPLMRMLLKPFRNERGETILVPSNKIYGGEDSGSLNTCRRLTQTMAAFVAPVHAGKSGVFRMDNRLYADGQVSTQTLRVDWSALTVDEAMIAYQENAVEEWMDELSNKKNMLARGERGEFNQDLTPEIRALESKIRRSFDVRDQKLGLMRLFHAAMVGSGIGNAPDPRQIIEAAEKPVLAGRQKAFEAICSGDMQEWRALSKDWPVAFGRRVLLAAIGVGTFSSDDALAAAIGELFDTEKSIFKSGTLKECLTSALEAVSGKHYYLSPELLVRYDQNYQAICSIFKRQPGYVTPDVLSELAKQAMYGLGIAKYAVYEAGLANFESVRALFQKSCADIRSKDGETSLEGLKIAKVLVEQHPVLVDAAFVKEMSRRPAGYANERYLCEARMNLLKAVAVRNQAFATEDMIFAILDLAEDGKDKPEDIFDAINKDSMRAHAQMEVWDVLYANPELSTPRVFDAVLRASLGGEGHGGSEMVAASYNLLLLVRNGAIPSGSFVADMTKVITKEPGAGSAAVEALGFVISGLRENITAETVDAFLKAGRSNVDSLLASKEQTSALFDEAKRMFGGTLRDPVDDSNKDSVRISVNSLNAARMAVCERPDLYKPHMIEDLGFIVSNEINWDVINEALSAIKACAGIDPGSATSALVSDLLLVDFKKDDLAYSEDIESVVDEIVALNPDAAIPGLLGALTDAMIGDGWDPFMGNSKYNTPERAKFEGVARRYRCLVGEVDAEEFVRKLVSVPDEGAHWKLSNAASEFFAARPDLANERLADVVTELVKSPDSSVRNRAVSIVYCIVPYCGEPAAQKILDALVPLAGEDPQWVVRSHSFYRIRDV
ncbi:MAG: hypothetical protein PHE27_05295, partial [Alphaproteobacteria bacterium]|nr:hypothetical protein [Alphaproteobacteria bacterium]